MRGAVLFVVLAAASCSDAVDSKAPTAPTNRCNSNTDCSAGSTCNKATLSCAVPLQSDLSVTYVISFPVASATLPGLTVAMPLAQLVPCRGAAQSCAPGAVCACATVAIGEYDDSSYSLSADKAKEFDGYKFGRKEQVRATIPVRAVFRPLTPFDAGTQFAATVGLPGLPTVGIPNFLRAGVPPPAISPGPQNAPAAWFGVTLPSGRYRRSLEPLAPFDELFPPITDVIEVTSDAAGVNIDGFKKNDHAFRLEVQATEPLTGWIGYLRDEATRLRISTIFRPKPGVNDVRLRHFGYTDLATQRAELVIEPPFGSPRPSFVSPRFPAATAETLPALPPAIRVSGGVFGAPSDVDLRATLVFRNETDRDVSLLEPRNSKLTYTTEVQTGADGTYAVDLPPGEYTVAVVPAYESEYGVALTTKFIVPSSSLNHELAGRGLSAQRLQVVEGVVTLPAGAPFAGAKVVLKPRETDSDNRAYGLARLRSTVTGVDGTFRVGVDPGIYDVVVEPPVESRWPRVIVSSLAPGVPIEVPVPRFPNVVDIVRVPAIALAAPIDLGFNLVDSRARRPVSGAIVRAFTTIAGRNTAVELVSGTTDTSGRVDLYAAPPR